MASANKALYVQALTQQNGKDRWIQNSKSPDTMWKIATNDAQYKMQLLQNNYQVLNMGNRTIGKDLTLLFVNSSKDNPLAKQINQNVGI